MKLYRSFIPSKGGDFQESHRCRRAAPLRMKILPIPPLNGSREKIQGKDALLRDRNRKLKPDAGHRVPTEISAAHRRSPSFLAHTDQAKENSHLKPPRNRLQDSSYCFVTD